MLLGPQRGRARRAVWKKINEELGQEKEESQQKSLRHSVREEFYIRRKMKAREQEMGDYSILF